MTSLNSERHIGLARAISKLGYCSRSRASDLIRAGRVALNGRLRRDPETPARLGRDRIAVDGRPLEESGKIYLMLNKPRGLVTTVSDEKGRATVYDCLPEHMRWIAPVGRLDKASEGLLLFSNDPEWADRILAPETHLEKTYHVQVRGVATDTTIQSLVRGVAADGEMLRAAIHPLPPAPGATPRDSAARTCVGCADSYPDPGPSQSTYSLRLREEWTRALGHDPFADRHGSRDSDHKSSSSSEERFLGNGP